jgi:hypothetical protein
MVEFQIGARFNARFAFEPKRLSGKLQTGLGFWQHSGFVSKKNASQAYSCCSDGLLGYQTLFT